MSVEPGCVFKNLNRSSYLSSLALTASASSRRLGRYTDVLKTPSSEMSKAWQMSLMTGGVAVAVRQMTRSALIS